MSIIRDFVTKLPAACGVPAGLAEIYGELNGKLFDFELANPDGPLNRKNFKAMGDRLELGISWYGTFGDDNATSYAHELLMFITKAIDADGGYWEGKDKAEQSLFSQEPLYPAISSLLSVEQASTLGNWA